MTETPRSTTTHARTEPALDPLAGFLEQAERDACFRVARTLKASPSETTELVYFAGANGSELGPFVRKLIARGSGLGGAYRILREAHANGVRHRHLPAVLDVHEAGENLVVLMEHVPGSTLRELVEQAGSAERRTIAQKALPALCAAATELHESFDQPLVHRDLTPSNVVCPRRNPAGLTVIDLGIARTHKPEASADTACLGTRAYAPPEQFGFGQTSPRTDIYALGMLLFFCLTGRDPTPADRQRGFAHEDVPEPLRAVVERATELEPSRRYRSAREMRVALTRAFVAAYKPKPASGNEQADAAAITWTPTPSVPHEPPAISREQSLRSRWQVFSARVNTFYQAIPHWLGRIWNFFVVLTYAIVIVGCVFAIKDPIEANAHLPLWLLVWDYAVFLNVYMGATFWLLTDKRRLRRRFPQLKWPSALKTLGVYCLVEILNFVLFIVANLIGNPVYA